MQKQVQQTVSTIRVSHKAKAKLTKISAKMTLKDGKLHTMEEIVDIVMEHYEKDHKE
jgi:ABC-type polysaccharide/polyol phosphate transport system ATPase subunit